MSAPEAISLDLPTVRLAGLRWRNGAARVRVLALHGWLDNAASFMPLASRIDDVDLVALDLAGHGRSDHRPRGAWYHLVDNLTDVNAALDALCWPRATLLGHSLGAALASMFASALPGRVDALWLIEGLGPVATAEPETARNLGRALAERARAVDKSPRVFADMAEAEAARRAATPMAAESVRLLVERGTHAVPGGLTWSSDPRLLLTSASRVTEGQIAALLAAIACPTLLIRAGTSEPYFTPELAATRIGMVRDIDSVELPGGHHLHLDDPAPVAATIAAFRARACADQSISRNERSCSERLG